MTHACQTLIYGLTDSKLVKLCKAYNFKFPMDDKKYCSFKFNTVS